MPQVKSDAPTQGLPVYRADQFPVVEGANLGDPISIAEGVQLDDIYKLGSGSSTKRLSFKAIAVNEFLISADSELGTKGNSLLLDCSLTLMSPDGQTTESLILVEVDQTGKTREIYLYPLAPISPSVGYAVVGIDITSAKTKFALLACVSFTRETLITRASGEQTPVEDLRAGDRILTRDDGAQEIRWIGQNTVRAVGAFAPIRIAAGALNNERDLLVSPDHRLFIYQRSDTLGAGRSELLVKARHLVNGDSIQVQKGGFVDYFQLLFDRHQLVYAEGIAAESLLIDSRTRPALPKDLSDKMGADILGHTDRPHRGLDVDKRLLERPDIAESLRKSSTR